MFFTRRNSFNKMLKHFISSAKYSVFHFKYSPRWFLLVWKLQIHKQKWRNIKECWQLNEHQQKPLSFFIICPPVSMSWIPTSTRNGQKSNEYEKHKVKKWNKNDHNKRAKVQLNISCEKRFINYTVRNIALNQSPIKRSHCC